MTANESPGQVRGGAATRVATRRTALIIWCVIVAGALGLTVVAVIFGPGIWPRVSGAGKIVAWVVFGMAVVCLLASRVVPSAVSGRSDSTTWPGPARIEPPEARVEALAVARSVVATAFNGSIALFAPLAWMISGKMIAIVALAISLVGLLLALPSERRWQKLRRDVVAARGQELEVGTDASTPQPTPSRRVMGWAVGLLVLGAGALVLAGNVFLSEQVLRRPASPIVLALLFLDLALMMIGLAIARFVRASSSRRPRWQRAYGVLLLVLAGYLLVQVVRIV